MKKKKRLRKVGIALLVVCGLAAFANSFSDHNKTPANNTPSIASYSLSVDDSAAAPAFADVYASAGQTASSSNFRGSYSGDLKDGKRNGTGSFRWTSNVTYSGRRATFRILQDFIMVFSSFYFAPSQQAPSRPIPRRPCEVYARGCICQRSCLLQLLKRLQPMMRLMVS